MAILMWECGLRISMSERLLTKCCTCVQAGMLSFTSLCSCRHPWRDKNVCEKTENHHVYHARKGKWLVFSHNIHCHSCCTLTTSAVRLQWKWLVFLYPHLYNCSTLKHWRTDWRRLRLKMLLWWQRMMSYEKNWQLWIMKTKDCKHLLLVKMTNHHRLVKEVLQQWSLFCFLASALAVSHFSRFCCMHVSLSQVETVTLCVSQCWTPTYFSHLRSPAWKVTPISQASFPVESTAVGPLHTHRRLLALDDSKEITTNQQSLPSSKALAVRRTELATASLHMSENAIASATVVVKEAERRCIH